MTATKKLFTDYTEVTTNEFTDQVPVLQSGNKKTTLQKIYNLFKTAFDEVYATETFATSAANTRIPKQSIAQVEINASEISDLSVSSCILSISNIPSGTGNKTITIRVLDEALTTEDVISTSVIYRGFDVNLRSWVLRDVGGEIILELFINVHSSPTEPVLIAINKIN